MFIGYVRYPDGSAETLSSLDSVPACLQRDGAVLWLDFEAPAEADLRRVAQWFSLDPDAIDDCLLGAQRPRMDEFDDHVFLLLYGMLAAEDRTCIELRKLAAFCGNSYLITAHPEPLRTIGEMRTRCGRSPAPILARGADFVLYSIVDGMVDKYQLIADRLEERIEELEDRSLTSAADDAILPPLIDLRRELIDLRRFAASQRELVLPLARGECDYIAESLEQRFNHVYHHLTDVVEALDSLLERLHGIRENYHTALTVRINDVMKTLTLFAAILLPMSVVAGIYGMNLQTWPSDKSPWGFWLVLGAMALLAVAMFRLFRRKRWL